MIRNEFVRNLCSSFRTKRILLNLRSISSSVDIEKLEKDSSVIDVIDEESKAREEEIQRKRNKSRLKVSDRNFLFEKNPYPEPTIWYHGTLKYLRRLYGRYGEASGVNPSICWPVKEELEEAKEYERVAYPFTIPDMIEDARKKRQEKEDRIRLRQAEMVKKMEKLEQMKQDLYNKIQKKEREALSAKERKQRLIEEVRLHFGYTVDPRDDKFKEMLEKKEKEQKKAMKEAKRKAREEAVVSKLLSKKPDPSKTLEASDTNKE